MIWIYIGLVFILIFIWILSKKSNIENFEQNGINNEQTIVGGSTASRVVYNAAGDSTNVLKLTGNTDQTIILIHNTPMNLQIWYPVFMEAQRAKNNGEKIPTMYIYDTIGHGTAWKSVPAKYMDTNVDNHIWTFDDYTDQFYTIYNELVTGKVTIVGYGTGGSIAQAIGIKYPDIVEKLVVLGTTIGPTEVGFTTELDYLVQWYKEQPEIDYLTMQKDFVNNNLCLWFENNNMIECPGNGNDSTDNTPTAQFLLADKTYRQASCSSYLQLDKLVKAEDLKNAWNKTKVNFPIQIVIGDRDHYTPLQVMLEDLQIVKNSAPATELIVVKGKHGFAISNSDLVYKLAMGQDISSDPSLVRIY